MPIVHCYTISSTMNQHLELKFCVHVAKDLHMIFNEFTRQKLTK